jgi:hypothetical protein
MLRHFVAAEYHTTEAKILQGQLNLAKPATASLAERVQRNTAEQ